MTDQPLAFQAPAGRVEVYQGQDDAFYWRPTASNGEQLASGEAHRDRHDALRAARRATLGPES